MRIYCYVLAVSVAATLFAVSANDAAAAGCDALPGADDFVVNVIVEAGEPNIYNDMSKAQLGTTNSHGRRRGAQILGTAQTGVNLRWSFRYQVREWRDTYCFWLASADVELSYQQLDVNIAAEYEPGSCQYEAILDHEKEHVEVARSIMSPYAQRIEQALTILAIPTSHLPTVADSPEIALQDADAVFEQALSPVSEQMNRLLDERQAEVDMFANYRRMWRSCRRW